MKKTYQMILASLLMLFGAMNVSAEEISLEEIPFWAHESAWGLDAPKTTPATPAFVIGEATGQPYGDSEVKAFADLSGYTKLEVLVTEGSPRFLFNRDIDEGQFSDNEAESHLIDNTKGGWCSKYFSSSESDDGTLWTVDLKQLVKDKGFAHLHAIKGANWQDVTVASMVVVSQGKAKSVGWTNLINNSDMEGDDVSSFFTRIYPDNSMPVPNSEITDGVGVNGSRGIVVSTVDKVENAWDSQFFFRFNEALKPGDKYRVSFDYRADEVAGADTQSHLEPGDYIYYELWGKVEFTTDWQNFSKEGEVTEQIYGPSQTAKEYGFLSVAFNLNDDSHPNANNYYFDNIKFEVYKNGTSVEFSNDVVLIDFGFDTNIPAIVKASGSRCVMFPNDCVIVKANNNDVAISSVEGRADGRFFIFLEEALGENDNVQVIFKNPAGELQVLYASGPNSGSPVPDADEIADYNEAIEEGDGYPFAYVTPIVKSSYPEQGSFNIPADTKNFTVTFDKPAEVAKIKATLDGKALTVNAEGDYATDIVLNYSGSKLSNGVHTIHLTNIYPEAIITDEVYADTTYQFSVGLPDENDQAYDLVPVSYFQDCAAGSVPEGYLVKFGEEERIPGGGYGSGSRMMSFGAGGDFTKGLYFREGFVQYGTTEDYLLALEAGKKYQIHFNSAMWKSNGASMTFEILTADTEEAVFTQTIQNSPDVNGSTAAVSGTTSTDLYFEPEVSNNYILKWSVGGFNEVLLANVSVSYVPSSFGAVEMMALNNAIAKAKETLEAFSDPRYEGEALDMLSYLIGKYENEKGDYTSPSECEAAVADLTSANETMANHGKLCNDYDAAIKKAIDVVRQNAENKFAGTALYANVKEGVDKYHGTSEWVNISEDEENPEWQLNYSYDVLTADAELAPAISELSAMADMASLLFTEGASAPENANGGKATGVAVLVDRLRLGVAALNQLGITESAAITLANNALTDDDAVADALKYELKMAMYEQLKNADNDLFLPVVDEETLEETTPSYDMTVFVKNPNIYKVETNLNFTDENIPGWTTPEGYNRPGLTVGWGSPKNIEGVAEDCMFQTWGGTYRVEQTINDLPVGIYTVKFAFGDRDNQEIDESYAYAMTSDSNEFRNEGIIPGIGQAFPFTTNTAATCLVEGIEVTDGVLTIGVNAGDGSHTFFNEVRLVMSNKLANFDYANAYTTGIGAAEDQKVVGIQLFDLNGRNIPVAKKGVVIVKRLMSDGTIKTQKVVK